MKELRICSALEMVIKEFRKAKEPLKPKNPIPIWRRTKLAIEHANQK